MAGVQLLLALLQLALLLRHLLLEDHLHLRFHLLQLLLVQRTFLFLLHRRVDLLEDAGVLSYAHGREAFGSVVFVKRIVGVLFQLFHVRADQHLAQLDKIAVILVVDFNHAPRIATATHFASFGAGNFAVGADDSKGHFGHDLVVFGNGLLVVEFVLGSLEDLNGVVADIAEDLSSVRLVLGHKA